jgi:hypothetical protein
MKCRIFIFALLCSLSTTVKGQATESNIDLSVLNAPNVVEIFNPTYGLDFYGIFDSSDYLLKVYAADWNYTPGGAFSLTGKTWHRNKIIPFTGTAHLMKASVVETTVIDTTHFGPLGLHVYDSLYLEGWKLYSGEGYYDFTEDSTQKYSGVFRGDFKIYFLYSHRYNSVLQIPLTINLFEPSLVFTGRWFIPSKPGKSVPAFWTSLKPIPVNEESKVLPDLRMMDDGNIQENKVLYLKLKTEEPKSFWFISSPK